MDQAESSVYQLVPGRTPLIVSMPHVGARVPEEIEHGFTPVARAVHDESGNA